MCNHVLEIQHNQIQHQYKSIFKHTQLLIQKNVHFPKVELHKPKNSDKNFGDLKMTLGI